MVGGVLWAAVTVIHALKPRGCVGLECARRPMRESTMGEGVLAMLAAALIVTGVVGLLLMARRTGRFRRTGAAGACVGGAGMAVLLLAGLAQAAWYDGDFSLMPYFVLPGMLALIVGFVLVGVAVLGAGVLPAWSGWLLVLGSLLMVGANEQTATVLLLVPFGGVWVVVGYLMWSRGPQLGSRSSARS